MNLEPYKHLCDGNDLEPMDGRHVQMIHAVLVSEQPESVVNIGIANGFSSVATLEAFKVYPMKTAAFVDVNVRDCFKQIVPCDPALQLCQKDSREINEAYKCWVIDGEHKEGAILDYEKAICSNAHIIIAHDTNPTWAPDVQWGAIEIGKRMRESCVAYFEDWADRKGEHTKRGLTVAFYYQPKQETMQRLQELAIPNAV